MKIYRIENEETHHGMWYRIDGTYDPFIKKLTEGKSKDLPMDFHERYSKDGFKWFSGCNNIEDMRHWFSNLDAYELCQNGYKLFEIECEQFIEEENQVLFTREGIVSKKEISLDSIWDISNIDLERKVKFLEDKLSTCESLLYEAHDLMSEVHCYDTDIYREISRYFEGE